VIPYVVSEDDVNSTCVACVGCGAIGHWEDLEKITACRYCGHFIYYLSRRIDEETVTPECGWKEDEVERIHGLRPWEESGDEFSIWDRDCEPDVVVRRVVW
jgi:hypothetical protein